MKCYEIYATYKVAQYLHDESGETIDKKFIQDRFTSGSMPTIATIVKRGYVLSFSIDDLYRSDVVYHIATVLERDTGEREYYRHNEQVSAIEIV